MDAIGILGRKRNLESVESLRSVSPALTGSLGMRFPVWKEASDFTGSCHSVAAGGREQMQPGHQFIMERTLGPDPVDGFIFAVSFHRGN